MDGRERREEDFGWEYENTVPGEDGQPDVLLGNCPFTKRGSSANINMERRRGRGDHMGKSSKILCEVHLD